ncbi:MAG: hypothetical protein MOGMAGMI_02170 [Candidatus Omnitrophica bacterium]|nr:hypothetical protein [Candidatus Omnitrophota bacterium]
MKLLKALLLAVGAVVLWRTFAAVDWATAGEALKRLDTVHCIFLFCLYAAVYYLNAAGWIFSYPADLKERLSVFTFFRVRLIGETLNNLIPFSASVGGEPVKAEILRRNHGIPLADSYAAILIVHVTFNLSLNVFVLGAWWAARGIYTVPDKLWQAVAVFLIVLFAATAGLVWALVSGLFEKSAGLARGLPLIGARLEGKTDRLRALDRAIRDYFRRPVWLAVSTLFNLAAWMTGVFEVYFGLRWLGSPVSLSQAWFLEATVQCVRVGTFFIPSGIGSQEAGIVWLFGQCGISGPVAAAFAVVRRLRELLWFALGLALWSATRERGTTARG